MKRIFTIDNSVIFIVSEKKLIRLNDDCTAKLRTPAALCLTALLENQGSLVTHKNLFYLGWECFGMSASLNVLHNTIFYLRKHLSKMGFKSNIIQTIPRRGFVISNNIEVKKELPGKLADNEFILNERKDEPDIGDDLSVSSKILQSSKSRDQLNFTSLTYIPGVDDDNYNDANDKLNFLELENSILKKLLSEVIVNNEELKNALMKK
ncbi:winged helix-turn-helix domain-containing protein [Pantoea ananatis]|uniref:winged helix-turn-helix domain-containing protein n=1 Tax=Pantoea ananas TaxID=553 RepID=UPI001B310F4B|nr:winged helix-turn-helix domain-containing protein [Pantoea ananatis]